MGLLLHWKLKVLKARRAKTPGARHRRKHPEKKGARIKTKTKKCPKK